MDDSQPSSPWSQRRKRRFTYGFSTKVQSQGARDWRTVKWLTPGIGIKRWGLLALIGLSCAIVGAALATALVSVDLGLYVSTWFYARSGRFLDPVALGIALLTGGVIGVIIGLRGTLQAVERAFSGHSSERADFLETALRRRKLELGERVVAFGGGTGLSTMLRGLKEYSSNITAVVTMADDGGSSGMLREEGMLPPATCATAWRRWPTRAADDGIVSASL
jgi:hypothetical protein